VFSFFIQTYIEQVTDLVTVVIAWGCSWGPLVFSAPHSFSNVDMFNAVKRKEIKSKEEHLGFYQFLDLII
jgi:hypothetical protein